MKKNSITIIVLAMFTSQLLLPFEGLAEGIQTDEVSAEEELVLDSKKDTIEGENLKSSEPSHVEPVVETAFSVTNSVPTVITSTWGTAPIELDTTTGILTVYAGTLESHPASTYFDNEGKITRNSVKEIILKDGVVAPADSRNLFSGNDYAFYFLTKIEGFLDTSQVTSMINMFSDAKSLVSVDVSNWDTSNVQYMNGLFFEANSLSQLDVSRWDTANVRAMTSMFNGASNLTTLDVSNWDTSNVTIMERMFNGVSKLSTLDVRNWKTENVTFMQAMFQGAMSLTSLDLSNWDTSAALQYMDNMFQGTSSLAQLDLGEKSVFHSRVALPAIDHSSGEYTGAWERIRPTAPESLYNSSDFFMSEYDGKNPGTYVWQRVRSKGANVTLKYVDEQGLEIAAPEILSGYIGDSYVSQPKAIDGYTFKEAQGNVTSLFTNAAQTVTFIYTKNPVKGAVVTVKYIDEQGNEIAPSELLSGHLGEEYSSYKKEINGYTYKAIQGKSTGPFLDVEQVVIYIYEKNAEKGANVTVIYTDEFGNLISQTEVLSGNVGETYKAIKKELKGYTYLEVKGEPTGSFTNKTQLVTYVYRKKGLGINEPKIETISSLVIMNHDRAIPAKQFKQKQSFPKTGAQETSWLLILGVAFITTVLVTSVKKRDER